MMQHYGQEMTSSLAWLYLKNIQDPEPLAHTLCNTHNHKASHNNAIIDQSQKAHGIILV